MQGNMQLVHSLKRRVFATLAILLLAGGLTGCATSFLYNRADGFAERWITGYLELDPAQQQELAEGLEGLHRWHRREELPRYSEWLRELSARLADDTPPDEAELRAWGDALADFWSSLAGEAMPLLTGLGAGLDDGQVDGLAAALRDEQEQQLEAALRRDHDWHAQRRARSMERFLRRWTGSLSNGQRAGLRAWAASLEPTHEVGFENRLGWIEELEAALAQRDQPDVLLAAAETLILDPSSRWSPEYRAMVERNAERTKAFMLDFLGRLEPRQRDRAIVRLQRLADEFDALARAGG